MLELRYRFYLFIYFLFREFYDGYILKRTSEFSSLTDFQFFPFIQSTYWYFKYCILNAVNVACVYIMSQHYQQIYVAEFIWSESLVL